MGDPGGIGPEIIVKAIHTGGIGNVCTPVVIGSASVMEETIRLLDLPLTLNILKTPEEAGRSLDSIAILEAGHLDDYSKCRPSAENGRASAECIRKAVELALEKHVDAIVTAPISKEALRMAGLPWPGHTEMLGELTNTTDYTMMLVGGPIRVILVTIHTSLRSVPATITKEKIVKTIRLAMRACRQMGLDTPRIAVAGLNPHAGEAGMFGDEERDEILPAIESARIEGIPVSGPYPPDTVFHKAYKGEFDIVVCMYHDQGLIPLKMIAFDTGVNVTVGLPIVRTSPDHGTAYDIAWQGKADPSSMIEAVKLASQLVPA